MIRIDKKRFFNFKLRIRNYLEDTLDIESGVAHPKLQQIRNYFINPEVYVYIDSKDEEEIDSIYKHLMDKFNGPRSKKIPLVMKHIYDIDEKFNFIN